MTAKLTCLFPDGSMKRCMRMDAAGSSESMLLIQISLSQDSKAEKTRQRTVAQIVPVAQDDSGDLDYRKSTALDRTGMTDTLQENVFIKWSKPGDTQRVLALAREASFYTNELRALQGAIVPRFLGHYVSSALNAKDDEGTFAISVFEDCSNTSASLTEVFEENGTLDFNWNLSRFKKSFLMDLRVSRQYMLAACTLHSIGVQHGQLSPPQSIAASSVSAYSDTSLLSLGREFFSMLFSEACETDDHVLPIISRKTDVRRDGRLQGVRVVDFTCAQRHICRGAPLNVRGHSGRFGVGLAISSHENSYCSELMRLEAAVATVN